MRRKNALAARQFDRILLIKPSAFGDVLHALPVLVKLRARYPEARIDWLITPENADLVRQHPALSNVVLFRRRQSGALRRGVALLRLLQQLRQTRYDLVIDLQGQLRSALFALATGARVRIGFDKPQRQTRTVSEDHALRNAPARGWRGARDCAWL